MKVSGFRLSQLIIFEWESNILGFGTKQYLGDIVGTEDLKKNIFHDHFIASPSSTFFDYTTFFSIQNNMAVLRLAAARQSALTKYIPLTTLRIPY